MNHSVLVGLIALSCLGGLWLWSAGARAGAAAQRMVQEVSRTAQVVGTALALAGLVTLIQWVVITHTTVWSVTGFALVFGLPALLCGVTVARMVVVTAIVRGGLSRVSGRRGGKRRVRR
jgi:hypothetical protein